MGEHRANASANFSDETSLGPAHLTHLKIRDRTLPHSRQSSNQSGHLPQYNMLNWSEQIQFRELRVRTRSARILAHVRPDGTQSKNWSLP